jgi:hypothetical protein
MTIHAPIGGTGMPGLLLSGCRKAGDFTRLLPLMLALLAPAPAPAEEEMELEGMAVFGNRELPKALFIVPWKDPQAGLSPERPVDSLVDQALQPVDPDVFRRKLEYYDTVHKTD